MGCSNQINKTTVIQLESGVLVPITALISDDVERQPRLDSSTHSLQMIDHGHHEVHDGVHYFVSGSTVLALENDVLGFTLTTPDTTKWIHMLWSVSSSGPITVQLYEGSSGISGGSSVTARNSNRNSSNTSGATILQTPTVATPGTLIASAAFGAAGAKAFAPTGGSTTRDSEIILKQNTAYYWKITANAATVTVSYNADWYEHTNKD